jgi:hypothetical protein
MRALPVVYRAAYVKTIYKNSITYEFHEGSSLFYHTVSSKEVSRQNRFYYIINAGLSPACRMPTFIINEIVTVGTLS